MIGKDKNSRPRIVQASNFHDGSLEFVLSNGNYFVVESKYILDLPGFETFAESESLFDPIVSEDGGAIYWRNGPRQIRIDELLSLIGKADGTQT